MAYNIVLSSESEAVQVPSFVTPNWFVANSSAQTSSSEGAGGIGVCKCHSDRDSGLVCQPSLCVSSIK